MAEGRDGAPMRIRELLSGASTRLGVERPIETGRIWARWAEIVGEGISEHAEPISLRDGTLRIRATSPAWAAELAYLVEQIKAAVNAEVGRPLVGQVVVSTGKSDRDRDPSAPVPTRSKPTDPGPSTEPPPADAAEALSRAHEAWIRRHSRGPDDPSEKPENPW